MVTPLVLRQLTADDEKAFFEGLKEWKPEDLAWYSFSYIPGMPYAEMLEILRQEHLGAELAPGRVPHTMLYGFVAGNIIGRVSVRHELNEKLLHRGGHIGYSVAEKYRRKGYATEMVKGALKFCQTLGLDKIMVTCADDNEPSWRIIEKVGGALQEKVFDEEDSEMIRRYWIDLKKRVADFKAD